MVWIISILACVVALLNFIADWSNATSAPQQCVVISMALLITVLPYCLSKSISGIIQAGELKKLNETLPTHPKLLASLANGPSDNQPESAPLGERDQGLLTTAQLFLYWTTTPSVVNAVGSVQPAGWSTDRVVVPTACGVNVTLLLGVPGAICTVPGNEPTVGSLLCKVTVNAAPPANACGLMGAFVASRRAVKICIV